MPRTAATFQSVFWEFTGRLGYEQDPDINPTGITTVLKQDLLRHFNGAYRKVWNLYPWEDTWDEGALTPTAGLLGYSAVGHGHIWNLYSADPRVAGATVTWIPGSTAKAGITVGTEFSTLFGFWRPVCPQFVITDTTADFVEALRDATLSYAEAAYLRASGQYQTAGSRNKDGDQQCEDLQALEFPRLQTKWWLRRKD